MDTNLPRSFYSPTQKILAVTLVLAGVDQQIVANFLGIRSLACLQHWIRSAAGGATQQIIGHPGREALNQQSIEERYRLLEQENKALLFFANFLSSQLYGVLPYKQKYGVNWPPKESFCFILESLKRIEDILGSLNQAQLQNIDPPHLHT